jgi:hypothetical protein
MVPTEHVEDVLRSLLGWLKERTDQALEQGHVAIISVAELHRELQAIVRKLDRAAILNSYSFSPTLQELDEAMRVRTFVRQLNLVSEPDESLLRAVSDFLRARSDRIEWARRALVHTSDLLELEADLTSVWDSKRTVVSLRDRAQPELDQGRLLLHECLQHRCRVQGLDTPSYFAAGSFHALADALAIGWHPRFRDLIKPNASPEEKE